MFYYFDFTRATMNANINDGATEKKTHTHINGINEGHNFKFEYEKYNGCIACGVLNQKQPLQIVTIVGFKIGWCVCVFFSRAFALVDSQFQRQTRILTGKVDHLKVSISLCETRLFFSVPACTCYPYSRRNLKYFICFECWTDLRSW